MNLKTYLAQVAELSGQWIDQNIKTQDNDLSYNLYKSMRYSLDGGGKKLRPALAMLGFDIVHPAALTISHPALPLACGIEMIHTYSLIHDDLPGMDNDEMRRGKPTNHMVFGEAVAILAGDGLLTKAFEIFLNPGYYPGIPADCYAAAAFELAKGTGSDGMVAGQYVDMVKSGDSGKIPAGSRLNTNKSEFDILKYIHTNKTAKFIAKSIEAGAILAGADKKTACDLREYGLHIGLAFQIVDDILDIVSTSEELGKPCGSDVQMNKLTYPGFMGVESARAEADRIIRECAVANIESYTGNAADILRELACYILDRRN